MGGRGDPLDQWCARKIGARKSPDQTPVWLDYQVYYCGTPVCSMSRPTCERGVKLHVDSPRSTVYSPQQEQQQPLALLEIKKHNISRCRRRHRRLNLFDTDCTAVQKPTIDSNFKCFVSPTAGGRGAVLKGIITRAHSKWDLRCTQKPICFQFFTDNTWSYLLRSSVITYCSV